MKCTVQSVGNNSIENAEKFLSGIPGGVEKAIKGALPHTSSILRKESVPAVRKRYDLSPAGIRKFLSVSYKAGGKTAEIKFRGNRVPLFQFGGASPKYPDYDKSRFVPVMIGGRFKMVHPGKAASGHQLNSTSPTKFDNAFVAMMPNGHVGIFERTGGISPNGSDEIREMKGLSIPEMLGGRSVSESLSAKAAEAFNAEMDAQITRIMNGGI